MAALFDGAHARNQPDRDLAQPWAPRSWRHSAFSTHPRQPTMLSSECERQQPNGMKDELPNGRNPSGRRERTLRPTPICFGNLEAPLPLVPSLCPSQKPAELL